MKIKKKYIRPVMEVLDPEVGPLMQEVVTSSFSTGTDDPKTGINDGEDILSRQNDFTFTDDNDDW